MQAGDTACAPRTFGFMIYRCVYGDDAGWARFVELLAAAALARLDKEPYESQPKDKLAWIVEDNKLELDGATKTHIRQKFRQWAGSVNGATYKTMYSVCIYADQEVMESVLESADMSLKDVLPRTAFVKLLHHAFDEQPREMIDGEFEITSAADERFADDMASEIYDGFEPIEGCSRRDVGWMKFQARRLFPWGYDLLMDDGWYNTYRRPPKIPSV